MTGDDTGVDNRVRPTFFVKLINIEVILTVSDVRRI